MATPEELRLFLQERLRALDSTLQLEPGSPANTHVVEPTVRRFMPDALETDLELFARTRLAQEFPNLAAGEGTAIADALVKPMRVLLEPFVREIRAIRRNQSLIDPDILNKDEADALVSNTFVRRKTGDYARGQVRAYFENPVSANIGGTNFAFSGTGRRFRPLTSQSITTEAMLLNQDGELFYFDVDYVAEAIGKAGNVDAGSIIGITNLPAATRVTNLRKFQNGLNEETSVEMIVRAEQSIGERSLTTVPGAVGVLFDQFLDLRILQIIGFNDVEMQRDVIRGGNLGDPEAFGVDGATINDGDGDGYTPYFNSATGSFTAAFGPVGTDMSGYALTAWFSVGGVLTPLDFDLKQVEGATQISISDDLLGASRLPEPTTARFWVIRKRVLTLSDIPGGILFPDVGGTTLDIPDDTIHIGGVTDFYVAGPTPEDVTLSLSLFGTYVPAIRGITGQTFGAGANSKKVWINSSTFVDFMVIIVGKSAIRLLSGSSTGTYRIVKADWDGGTSTIKLEINTDTSAAESNLIFDISDSVDIGLVDPKEVLLSGSDLRTYAGSDMVDTGSVTAWATYGITSDHVLELLNGDDVGEYNISSVVGSALFLGAVMGQTADPIQYRIIKKQGVGIERPMVRVTSIERLDANLEPTGDFIPYRHPIDARSRSFQNPGRGRKAGTQDVTTDDLLAVAPLTDPNLLTSDNTSVNYFALGVRPGDIVNILTGDNIGYFTVSADGVGGSPAAAVGLNDYELRVDELLSWAETDMSYEVGEPSYGSFRIYFLEPVSFVVDSDTTFIAVTLSDGTVRRFRPDPLLWDEYFPTDSTIPTMEANTPSSTIELWTAGGSTGLNTDVHDVVIGDRVEVTFAPIVGSKDHGSATTILDNKTLLLDLGSGPERVLFTGTIGINDVVTQVNTQLSRDVAAKFESGGASYFMIRSDQEVTVLDNSADANDATADVFGTTPATNNPWLNAAAPIGVGVFATFVGESIPNDSPYKGFWFVTGQSANTAVLADADAAAFAPIWDVEKEIGHYLVFAKEGRQSISSTVMNDQRDSLGLYYFDVECASEGYGDTWNVDPDLRGAVSGYEAEGWEITTEDAILSYSMAEQAWIHISPRILIVGAENDPSNYTELIGGSIQLNYERSPLVETVDSFVRDQQNRVVCQSPLVRHLTPIFVRTSIQYSGGSTESDARTDLVDIVEAVVPEQQLEVSDLTGKLTELGSDHVLMPVTLIGIKHETDRTIIIERSQDSISTERLSSLIPDDDGTTTEGASWLQLVRT